MPLALSLIKQVKPVPVVLKEIGNMVDKETKEIRENYIATLIVTSFIVAIWSILEMMLVYKTEPARIQDIDFLWGFNLLFDFWFALPCVYFYFEFNQAMTQSKIPKRKKLFTCDILFYLYCGFTFVIEPCCIFLLVNAIL